MTGLISDNFSSVIKAQQNLSFSYKSYWPQFLVPNLKFLLQFLDKHR
jgi:hypothetical protein